MPANFLLEFWIPCYTHIDSSDSMWLMTKDRCCTGKYKQLQDIFTKPLIPAITTKHIFEYSHLIAVREKMIPVDNDITWKQHFF